MTEEIKTINYILNFAGRVWHFQNSLARGHSSCANMYEDQGLSPCVLYTTALFINRSGTMEKTLSKAPSARTALPNL